MTLVEEFGGKCALCGYDRYLGAIQFHHVDPEQKSFGLACGGITRAIKKVREEAVKCVPLCANCHAEVEGGFARLSDASIRVSRVVEQGNRDGVITTVTVGDSSAGRARDC